MASACQNEQYLSLVVGQLTRLIIAVNCKDGFALSLLIFPYLVLIETGVRGALHV
jgi:hypothetical protein